MPACRVGHPKIDPLSVEKEKQETNAKRLTDVDNGLADIGADGKVITKTKVKNIKIDDTEINYEYITIWFASIFLQVKLKIGTIMNSIGQSGCGKSFAIETIYELLGIFAFKNVDEIKKIFGKFNTLTAAAILINFNEISDASDSFNLQHKMKSVITQSSGIIERKGIDSVESEIWSNFICTCNDVNAIPAEKGNRRTLDIQGFDAEDFIVQASRKTDVAYNEQLERQYTGLNKVD
ncbi:MAG: hypothetical protein EZS28_020906 [Streblomastix strix]|uniref:NrS-1 polymerase-like helicase domain-containing protein n=1 Tax=Streblomastix strix TaxID=222440 RepID=A0A5J4VMM5_9EUKA|nr:MAG: hypothetical protein EZS28_020906 [Streblomastix strix]